jgi:hypothetical protein
MQVGIILGIAINDLQYVFLSAGTEGGCNETLDVEAIRVYEEVHHGLEIVGIGSSDVCGYNDAIAGGGSTPSCIAAVLSGAIDAWTSMSESVPARQINSTIAGFNIFLTFMLSALQKELSNDLK